VIDAGFLLLMEQHFRLSLRGFVLILNHVSEVYVVALIFYGQSWNVILKF
jgi:hypothetical protein